MPRSDRRNADLRPALDGIRNLVRALRISDREQERLLGMSSAQMFVLHEIAQEESISLTDLAERTVTDLSSVSVVVKKLEGNGFITRRQSKEDARRVELTLTAKGRRLASRAPQPPQERLMKAIQALSPARRRQLATLLAELTKEMGSHLATPPMLFEESETKRKK